MTCALPSLAMPWVSLGPKLVPQARPGAKVPATMAEPNMGCGVIAHPASTEQAQRPTTRTRRPCRPPSGCRTRTSVSDGLPTAASVQTGRGTRRDCVTFAHVTTGLRRSCRRFQRAAPDAVRAPASSLRYAACTLLLRPPGRNDMTTAEDRAQLGQLAAARAARRLI